MSSVTLQVDNSFCRITGVTVKQLSELRELLSYRVEANYFAGGHRSTKRYLIDKRGSFPTGLVPHVMGYLNKACIQYAFKSNRTQPAAQESIFHLNLPVTPYPDQLKAVEAALKAQRGTISMPTGSGKSITMALLVQALQLRTLIIVPNLNLKNQLQASFEQYFGSLDNIVIENIDSPSLSKHTKFDVLIIDEAHHVAASTYRKLNKTAWNGIYYRFFFTATPFRSRDEEQLLMESISGQVVYRLEYQQAVDAGFIVPVEAYFVAVPKTTMESNSWPAVYSGLVVKNDHRNALIADMIKILHSAGQSVLCLVKEIAHGEELARLTGAAFAHGSNEESDDLIRWFSEGRLKSLIATTGVAGEGTDTKAAEWVIIAGLGKSKPAFMQQVGRGVRRYGEKQSAKVILLKDPSHKFTLRHFAAQTKILRDEYGIQAVKLEFSL